MRKVFIFVLLIFNLAMYDIVFVNMYARLCNLLITHLPVIALPPVDQPAEPVPVKSFAAAMASQAVAAPPNQVGFRKLLLNICQKVFEKEDFVAANGASEQEIAVEKKQQHIRLLGTMQLVGELFRLRNIPPKIMTNCLFQLLKLRSEEDIEVLTFFIFIFI